jgi:hypothetical protein
MKKQREKNKGRIHLGHTLNNHVPFFNFWLEVLGLHRGTKSLCFSVVAAEVISFLIFIRQ